MKVADQSGFFTLDQYVVLWVGGIGHLNTLDRFVVLRERGPAHYLPRNPWGNYLNSRSEVLSYLGPQYLGPMSAKTLRIREGIRGTEGNALDPRY